MYPSINQSFHRSTKSIHPSTYISIHPPIHLQYWSSIHPSTTSIHTLYNHPSIHISIHHNIIHPCTLSLGLYDMSHAIFNAHLVSKASPVIGGNFHHVCDFTWSSIYHTEPLFTDKLHKSRLIINVHNIHHSIYSICPCIIFIIHLQYPSIHHSIYSICPCIIHSIYNIHPSIYLSIHIHQSIYPSSIYSICPCIIFIIQLNIHLHPSLHLQYLSMHNIYQSKIYIHPSILQLHLQYLSMHNIYHQSKITSIHIHPSIYRSIYSICPSIIYFIHWQYPSPPQKPIHPSSEFWLNSAEHN